MIILPQTLEFADLKKGHFFLTTGGGGGDGRGVVWFGMIHRRFGLDSWTRLCNSGEMSLSRGEGGFWTKSERKKRRKKIGKGAQKIGVCIFQTTKSSKSFS